LIDQKAVFCKGYLFSLEHFRGIAAAGPKRERIEKKGASAEIKSFSAKPLWFFWLDFYGNAVTALDCLFFQYLFELFGRSLVETRGG